MKTFVEIIVDIPKEDLPLRISRFVHQLEPDKQEELTSILSSLAFYGAAESIRWAFFPEASESIIAEQIDLAAAKEFPDPDIF